MNIEYSIINKNNKLITIQKVFDNRILADMEYILPSMR